MSLSTPELRKLLNDVLSIFRSLNMSGFDYQSVECRIDAFLANKNADDGWIPYDGSGMPVDGDVKVDVKLRAGAIAGEGWPQVAASWRWSHNDGIFSNINDIIAYRIANDHAAQLVPSGSADKIVDADAASTGAAAAACPTICDCIDSLECKGIAECRFKDTHIPESIRKTSAEPAAGAEGTPDRRFEFLLNAFEPASQSAHPSANGYLEKRRALIDFVDGLQRENEELRKVMAMKQSLIERQDSAQVVLCERAEAAERELAAMKKAQDEAAKGLPLPPADDGMVRVPKETPDTWIADAWALFGMPPAKAGEIYKAAIAAATTSPSTAPSPRR